MTVPEFKVSPVRDFLSERVENFISTKILHQRFGPTCVQQAIPYLARYEGLQFFIVENRGRRTPSFISLRSLTPSIWVAPNIKELVLRKNIDLFCKMCGHENGDMDPTTPGRRMRLFVYQASLAAPVPTTSSGRSNSAAVCIACLEGLHGLKGLRTWQPVNDLPDPVEILVQLTQPNR